MIAADASALLIGITEYEDMSLSPLPCAQADVEELGRLLESHIDGSPNFDVVPLIVSSANRLTAADILRAVDREIEGKQHFLFYFSGHGVAGPFGLQLATLEKSDPEDSGVYFDALLHRFNRSTVPEITVILDCCFAGGAGDRSYEHAGQALQFMHLREGITILASCRRHEESEGSIDGPSIFTKSLVGTLDGGSEANVLDLYQTVRHDLDTQTPVLRAFGSAFSELRMATRTR